MITNEHESPNSFTFFDGNRRVVTGSLQVIALAVKMALESGSTGPVLIFDDATGRPFDINTTGSDDDVLSRLEKVDSPKIQASSQETEGAGGQRGRGRPKLGVVAREVTLLPRHWEWLATQPGSASVALRKLIEEARRTHAERDMQRKTRERAYHFMAAIGGDLPGFEEASRALFAGDRRRFGSLIEAWPIDVRDHAMRLASGPNAGN